MNRFDHQPLNSLEEMSISAEIKRNLKLKTRILKMVIARLMKKTIWQTKIRNQMTRNHSII
jgi:hypothetical protein